MEKITITHQGDLKGDIWHFNVVIGEGKNTTEHAVELSREYWAVLTEGKADMDPVALIRHSFEFLFAHESKESILAQFNLRDIVRYFPEYEDKMKGL